MRESLEKQIRLCDIVEFCVEENEMINLNLKLLKDNFEREFLSSETGEVKEAHSDNIFSSGSL